MSSAVHPEQGDFLTKKLRSEPEALARRAAGEGLVDIARNNLTSLNKWASTSAARCWPSTSTPAGRDQWLPPWAIAVLRTISPQVSTNQSGKAFMPPMVRASTIRSWSDGIPDWRRNRFPSIASSFPTSFWNLDDAFSGTG